MNSDQIMMRDPTTASSRIYVGNLIENLTNQDFSNHFSKYGPIRGAVINRGFGFIQFENDASANQAIQNENNGQFQGRKIIVRNAMKNTQNTGVNANAVHKPGGANANTAADSTVPQDLNRTAQMPKVNRKRGGKGRNKNMNENNDDQMDDQGFYKGPFFFFLSSPNFKFLF